MVSRLETAGVTDVEFAKYTARDLDPHKFCSKVMLDATCTIYTEGRQSLLLCLSVFDKV